MNLKRIPLAYKIIIPFALLNIIVASLAGPIARNWVALRIEQGANQHMDDGAIAIRGIFQDKEREVKLRSQVMTAHQEIADALGSGDKSRLLKELLPLKASFGVDSFAVADERGRVVEEVGGLLEKQQEIKDWPLYKQGMVEMNTAYLLKTKRGVQLVGVNPIRAKTGVNGVILVGMDINPVLKEIKEKFGYDSAIIWNDGVASSTLTDDQQKGVSLEKAGRRVAESGIQEIATTGNAENPQRIIFTPLLLNGERVGAVAILTSDFQVNMAKWEVVTNTVILNVLVVIIMAVIGYAIAKGLSNPLERVADAAGAIASGDFSERVQVRSNDEIGDLAEMFNKMGESLEQRDEELTRRINELSILHDVSAAFGRASSLENLLDALLVPALKLSGAETCYIGLINESGLGLSPEAWRSIDKDDSEHIIATLRSLAATDLEKTVAPTMHESPIIGHIACIPLRLGDSTNGTMALTRVDAPFTGDEVRLLATLAGEAAVAVEKVRLFHGLREASMNTVKALANAVEAKDPYTRGHSEQVTKLTLLLADELGLSEIQKQSLETAAYLHDIGKIGVPDNILIKDSALSADERAAIQQHALVGANILSTAPFPWLVTPIVRHHHERYDGKGYPAGLTKGEIPLASRILAIADAFDAIISDRPYRKARSVEEALAELQHCAGTQFDPYLVGLFVRMIKGKKETIVGSRTGDIPLKKRWLREVFAKVGSLLIEGYGGLAGPRVAGSLEARLNEFMVHAGHDVLVSGGRFEICSDGTDDFDQELDVLRDILRIEIDMISSVAGSLVAQRLYQNAIDHLSEAERRVLDHFSLVPQFQRQSSKRSGSR